MTEVIKDKERERESGKTGERQIRQREKRRERQERERRGGGRRYLCARLSPCALRPISQECSLRCFWSSLSISLTGDGPYSKELTKRGNNISGCHWTPFCNSKNGRNCKIPEEAQAPKILLIKSATTEPRCYIEVNSQ